MSKPEYTCPECGGHRFNIEVKQTVEVTFDADDGHYVEDGPFGDIEWGDESQAICREHCGWAGQLSECKGTQQ